MQANSTRLQGERLPDYGKVDRRVSNLRDDKVGAEETEEDVVQSYRKAAALGDPIARQTLGCMYEYGQGVVQNKAEAARWYRMAAEQNNTRAQICLGLMYQHGQGVGQDYLEAAKLFSRAAALGDEIGKKHLSRLCRMIRAASEVEQP